MRVGIVTYDYLPPIGGLGIVARRFVVALRRLFPMNAYIVLSPTTGADDRVSALATLRWRRRGGCPLFSLLFALKQERMIRRHRLDLLHVHAGSGGVFILRKPSCPLVVTAHHSYLQEAELVFRHPLMRLWKRFMALLEARTYQLADRVVCVSRDTAELVITRFGQSPSKVVTVENCLDDPGSRVLPRSSDGKTVLFVGRLEERKGIWVLLSAFEEIKKSSPATRLRIIGQNLLGSTLRRYIRSKGLEGSIDIMGYVYEPLLLRELAATTVLVVPSLIEGFGLIAAESMLKGTAVIVSDCPGLKTLIENGRTGWVFHSGDPHDLARCITVALTDAKARERIEVAAKQEARTRFSIDLRAQDLQREFDQTARKNK